MTSSSAQIFASIDDLLIQVFQRIPLKQLFRFKLVSKHWKSIISDPKLLSLRNPQPAVGLIFTCGAEVKDRIFNPSYILYFNQPTITKPTGELFDHAAKVLHSCNGLLLCLSYNGGAYIHNPITKKSSTLHLQRSRASICGMYLAFDPSKSCHYKFVCVVGLGENSSWLGPRFKLEVYSSETGSGRRCGEPFSATVDFKSGGVYWKGAIHWVSLTKTGKSIYFNPDDDQMLPTVMPSPPILNDGLKKEGRNYHFGESCGHLHFIDSYRKEFEFNVYEMKTDYSEWFVKYRVDLSNVFSDFFCVCTLVRGKKDDDTFLVLQIGRRFIRCNLVDKTCETISELGQGIYTQLEKEMLGHDADFPIQYIEGAYGNVDGICLFATLKKKLDPRKNVKS